MQPEHCGEHLQLGDYYSQENVVAGEWVEISAGQPRLAGRVKEDQFVKLCHNQDPNAGALLTQPSGKNTAVLNRCH